MPYSKVHSSPAVHPSDLWLARGMPDVETTVVSTRGAMSFCQQRDEDSGHRRSHSQ